MQDEGKDRYKTGVGQREGQQKKQDGKKNMLKKGKGVGAQGR